MKKLLLTLPLCATSVLADSTIKLTYSVTQTDIAYDTGFEFDVDSIDNTNLDYRYITDNNFVIKANYNSGRIRTKPFEDPDAGLVANTDIEVTSYGLGLGYAFSNNLDTKSGTGLLALAGVEQVNSTYNARVESITTLEPIVDENLTINEWYENQLRAGTQTEYEDYVDEYRIPKIFMEIQKGLMPKIFLETAASIPIDLDKSPLTYSIGLGYNVNENLNLSLGISESQINYNDSDSTDIFIDTDRGRTNGVYFVASLTL